MDIKRFKDFIKETKIIVTESSLSRILSHEENKNLGILSAFRGENSKTENLAAAKKLASEIRAAGFGYITVEGTFIETREDGSKHKQKEKSFIVVGEPNDSGKLKGLVKKLGIKYDQDAVIYKEASSDSAILIGTTNREDAFVPFGQSKNIGKITPKKAGEMFTKLKGNSTFIFENDLIFSYRMPNVYVRGHYLQDLGVKLEDIDGVFVSDILAEKN